MAKLVNHCNLVIVQIVKEKKWALYCDLLRFPTDQLFFGGTASLALKPFSLLCCGCNFSENIISDQSVLNEVD